MKLEKSTFPANHNPNDFKAFGPPAMEDGNFENYKIADMGSFSQGENSKGSDSNKFYHAAVVQSKINGKWYVYFEWGRVGATNPQFQFTECCDENQAQSIFAAQCHEKNDKRGVWTTIAGKRTLTAKPGKDVYLVRQLATRSCGLPDCKTIKYTEDIKKIVKTPKLKSSIKIDPISAKLLADLSGGTISYTRGAMADSSIPSQTAIDYARDILTAAQKRLLIVGDDFDSQIADRDLRDYSAELYRRIPKKKPIGTPDEVWILSQNNILSWQSDLDAFESALNLETTENEEVSDPYYGLPISMEWLDPKSEIGQFMYYWWPKATANKHYNLRELKVKNIWKISRNGDHEKLIATQERIIKDNPKISHKPLFQPNERVDVISSEKERYIKSNTGLLHHGTRSANLIGLMKENFRQPKELTGVVITGAMFSGCGGGTYLADDIKKSAGYTSLAGSYWSKGSGGIKSRDAFMLTCDVVLGEPHLAPGPHPYIKPPNGTHCIFGKGRNALAYTSGKEYSGVENNEWIVFNKHQTEMRYLVEFSQ